MSLNRKRLRLLHYNTLRLIKFHDTLIIMKLRRTLDDLKRTADANTQYDSALSLASSKEKEVAAKTETMKALHRNLGVYTHVLLPLHPTLHNTTPTAINYALLSSILCYPNLSYSILSYPILSYPIPSYPILSYPILSYPILSYPILSYPILSDRKSVV